MTLGNDPQPLTRRQARELAESQAESSTDQDGSVPGAKGITKAPSGNKAPRIFTPASGAGAAELPPRMDDTPLAPQAARVSRRARSVDGGATTPTPAGTLPNKAAPTKSAEPGPPAAKSAGAQPADTKSAAGSSAVETAGAGHAEPGALPEPVTTERTYTRRELRARTASAEPSAADAPPADAAPPAAARIGTEASAPGPSDARPVQALPPMSRPSVVRPFPVRPPVAIDDSVPIPPVPANHGRPAASDEVESTPAPFDASRLPGLHPPLGHWSVGPDYDDDAHRSADARAEAFDRSESLDESAPFDQIIARGLGSGGIPTTTNALILPSIPNQGSTSGPLADSGEILITGSFDLPRSLGSTGQLPNHFDSSEMDHMLDQFDDDGATGAAAPVSASRAVSTHASTRNVMTAPKRRLPSLPAVLASTAAVLALGVLALFVGGYLLNIF